MSVDKKAIIDQVTALKISELSPPKGWEVVFGDIKNLDRTTTSAPPSEADNKKDADKAEYIVVFKKTECATGKGKENEKENNDKNNDNDNKLKSDSSKNSEANGIATDQKSSEEVFRIKYIVIVKERANFITNKGASHFQEPRHCLYLFMDNPDVSVTFNTASQNFLAQCYDSAPETLSYALRNYNSIHLLTEQQVIPSKGLKMIGYGLGDMTEFMSKRFFNHIVKIAMLNEVEAKFFLNVCGHKPLGVAEEMLIAKLNAFCSSKQYDEAIKIAQRIHKKSIENNKRLGRLVSSSFDSDLTLPLDDANALFDLGTELTSISPQHAYKAFEAITKHSPFYIEAQGKLALLAISFVKDPNLHTTSRRLYREAAMKFLFSSLINFNSLAANMNLIMHLWAEHAGFDDLETRKFIGDFCAEESISNDTAIDQLLFLCDYLYALKHPDESKLISSFDTDRKNHYDRSHVTQAASSLLDLSGPFPSSAPPKVNLKKRLIRLEEEGWHIAKGDLNTFSANKDCKDSVVFEKKLRNEIAAQPNTTLSSSAQVNEFDSKEKQDISGTFTHFVFANATRLYHRKDLDRNVTIGDPAFTVILFFATEDSHALKSTSEEFEALKRKIGDLHYYSPQHFSDVDFMQHNNSISRKKYLVVRVGDMRQIAIEELFNFLWKSGLISQKEARYFKKMGASKPVSIKELALSKQMNLALEKKEYDEAITIARQVHLDSIAENRRKKIIHGDFEDLFTTESLFLDDATALYDLGLRLSSISPSHACKALGFISENSLLYLVAQEHLCHLGLLTRPGSMDLISHTNGCKESEEEQVRLRCQRAKTIKHLYRKEDLNGPEVDRLLLNYIEVHSGFEPMDPTNRLFTESALAVKYDVIVAQGFIKIFLILVNKIYQLKQKEPDCSNAGVVAGVASGAVSGMANGAASVVSAGVAAGASVSAAAGVLADSTADRKTSGDAINANIKGTAPQSNFGPVLNGYHNKSAVGINPGSAASTTAAMTTAAAAAATATLVTTNIGTGSLSDDDEPSSPAKP